MKCNAVWAQWPLEELSEQEPVKGETVNIALWLQPLQGRKSQRGFHPPVPPKKCCSLSQVCSTSFGLLIYMWHASVPILILDRLAADRDMPVWQILLFVQSLLLLCCRQTTQCTKL